jgi:hypothetical protein
MSTCSGRKRALATLASVLVTTLPATLGAATAAEATDHAQRSVAVHLLPPTSQTGAAAAPVADARLVAEVRVRPRATRRPVVLEQRTATGWRAVASGLTNKQGLARLSLPQGGIPTYRAATPTGNAHRFVRSEQVADPWGAPDFVDEFDGATLGPAWEHRIQFYNPWGGRACSKGDPSAVAVSGGALRLTSMVDPAASGLCSATDRQGRPLGDFPYRLNGHISTQHSIDFLYGVAAARMRFPRSLGQHASFWLQPRGLLDTGPTPWGAEIDVVEWFGSHGRRDVMASTVHQPQDDGTSRLIGGLIKDPRRFLATRADSWWTRFHVFSVEWTPQEYTFRIGAREVWRTHRGVSDVPEFLILSMLSSDFELPEVGTDPTPRTLEVDWVAFWQGQAP